MNILNNHSSVIFVGNLPIGKALFLKLENAFLFAKENEIIEIVSTNPKVELELQSWCNLKGYKLFDKRILKNQYCYKVLNTKTSHFNTQAISNFTMKGIETNSPKMSDWNYHGNDSLLSKAPQNHGLMGRDTVIENGSITYNFAINHKEQLWAEPVAKLYEEAKNGQWNATSDIAWNEIPNFDPKFEQAICQIMTYLIENEFSALYIPGKFISQMNPYYMEIPLFLGSLMNDEARHIEVFTKRVNANGGGMQYSSSVTQRSLYSLFQEDDYVKSSFLLHVMGEGTFIDLLKFLEEYMPDDTTKKILQYVRRDESRHVAYGMAHLKSVLEQNPKKINALKETAFKRKEFMDELNGESTLLIEAMSLLVGGDDSIASYKRGYEAVTELKKRMDINRVKRLVDIGIDEDLAHDISKVHTPNFM
jgi:TusA-related sulfurtransferase